INSKGSISKSYFIRLLSYKLIKIATTKNLPKPIIRYTPTRVAINNIDGYTIYSLLKHHA
ncbi:hypothetical protein QBC45DRAFT_340770, partial [Copromyces sp. CBS 386.78]